MNKLASILAALILTASVVGCSDEKAPDNSAVKADNSSNVAQNTDPKKEDESASSFKKNFISSCILGSGVTDDALIPQITEVCSCTYDNIIKDYGMTEFIRVDMEKTALNRFRKSGISIKLLSNVYQPSPNNPGWILFLFSRTTTVNHLQTKWEKIFSHFASLKTAILRFLIA